uniref:Uncharacterized protein n=1 Tax=Noctiluca scintillans TaxID=2966 RepID=A0A7S1F0E9_NOCSC
MASVVKVLLAGGFATTIQGAFCPKGFTGSQAFPVEWEIPLWPMNLTDEQASELRTVTLTGFGNDYLNQEFLEGPSQDFLVQGRNTYWAGTGDFFLYWCDNFKKWRIAQVKGYKANRDGKCLAFASDSHRDRDILDPNFLKGWTEAEEGKWVEKPEAGVDGLGTLAEKMAIIAELEAAEARTRGNESDECDPDDPFCDEDEDEDSPKNTVPFGGETKDGKCPLRPIAFMVKEKAKDVAKKAMNFMKTMLPMLLGPPVPEEEL